MEIHVKEYYKSVCEAYRLGNIESTYNSAIITLLSQFGCIPQDMSGERKGKVGENIDIKLWHSNENPSETEPFAIVEVKKVGGIDIRAREQIKTASKIYGNAILTDNLEWRFYRANDDKMYTGLELITKTNEGLVLRTENIELFISLMEDFMLLDPVQIRSSNKLAEYMAIHAKTIRSVIVGILKDDGTGQPLVDDRQKKLPMFLELYGLYGRIKTELRPLLTSRAFADMYAQTIVYGLFIARYNDVSNKIFDRYKAIESLREESALLNRFFTHIASTGKTHPTLEAVIDKLCVLYQTCDISTLLDQEERRDTIVHFYEDFLTFYDPELRKSLGVFYTPNQVVRYLISMVDKALIEDFGITGGLSNNEQLQISLPSEHYEEKVKHGKGYRTVHRDTKEITVPKVAILDPACGTGTFHAEIIKYIKSTYFSGMREAFYLDYIKDENGLLSRLIGFEIMMTSYVVAHLNIRRAITETLGTAPETQLPTSIYLTNTLAKPNSTLEQTEQMTLFDFSAAITEEAYKADTWKTRRPIKVIIGNPPYLAASTNPFDISAYRTETDGITPLQERNSKMLGDDYVKFFRFAEQIINKNNEGILAFVAPHGYLDNTTFRGMRASLLRTFDKIFVIDLHGNSNKGEVSPNGGADENIFDIKQGIALFVGIKTTTNNDWAKIYHVDLWGRRENKFQQLQEGNLQFAEISPDEERAYFIPVTSDIKGLYENGICITELFPTYVTGINSGNDKVSIAPTESELNRRIAVVKNAFDEKPILGLFGKFTRDQTAEKIQNDLLLNEGVIAPIDYRPFDIRWTYYSGKSGGWLDMPREKRTMGQMLQPATSPIGKNIGLVFSKTMIKPHSFAAVFISDAIIEKGVLCTVDRAYVAPLYLHSESAIDGEEWRANFNNDVLAKLTQNLATPPSPIEIFDYVYGVLHDPVYREKYNEFLKRDFPRIPIIENEEVFRAYVSAGEQLRKLHLMQIKVTAELTLEPNTAEDLEIGTVKYKDGILHLNSNKQIIGIPEDVWSYRIGGYQVIDKWLKSHKGKTMTIDDFDHIANIVGLIAKTINIQEELRRAE